jgi:hypothetical protein
MQRVRSLSQLVESDSKRKKHANYEMLPNEVVRVIMQFATQIDVRSNQNVCEVFGRRQGKIELIFDACNLYADVALPNGIRNVHVHCMPPSTVINLESYKKIPISMTQFTVTYNEYALRSKIIHSIVKKLLEPLNLTSSREPYTRALEHLALINSEVCYPKPNNYLYQNIFDELHHFQNLLSLEINADFKKINLVFPPNLRCLRLIFKTNRKAKSFGSLKNLEVLTLEQGAVGQQFNYCISLYVTVNCVIDMGIFL